MSEAQKTYTRFSVFERVEHFVLVLSFTMLCVTGLPQKYALSPISQAVIAFLGGIETTRIIHHISAAVFLLEAVYHIVIVAYKLYIQRKQATMVPTVKDGLDAYQWFGFNLGFIKKAPKMPRYNFMEKAEYWAMLWGLLVMGLTGLMLWNPIATTNILPGEFIPAAKAAHGGEAVLAALAIILWHFYNVHIKHWNWAMIKGTITHHEMEEEHGAELEAIESGALPQKPSPDMVGKRMAIFVPAAAIVSLALVALTYYFLTFEKTAIATVPQVEAGVQVFAPQTATPSPMPSPTATAAPTSTPGAEGEQPSGSQASSVAWTGGIEKMLGDKCGTCHGSAALGGFSSASYDDVMKVVKAGDPDNSPIVEVQKKGGHPGQLSDDELNQLIAWIKAGAAKDGGSAAEQPASSGTDTGSSSGSASAAGSDTWASGIGDLFTTKCGTCHGSTALGGFSTASYQDVVKMLKPGDSAGSTLVDVQKKGSHPGSFTAEELDRVMKWIDAQAPEK